jgi:hypothetical protein
MVRRFICAVAVFTCPGLYAFAAEQVTFILNNGERTSGEVIVAGADGANYVDGQLNLSGRPFPLDQVADIDLTGGTPSALELFRVPQSSAQTVVLRALIGKVGNSAPFGIGSNAAPIRMPAKGRLLLGVNDNELNDNSGYFSVVVTKQ